MRKIPFCLFFISAFFLWSGVVGSGERQSLDSGGLLHEEARRHYENFQRYVPGELIIKYKGSAPDAERALNGLERTYRLSSWSKLFAPPPKKKVFSRRDERKPRNFKKPNLDNIYLIQFAEDIDVEALARELMKDPQVEYAHPNYLLYALETIPNDTYFNEQWALRNTGQTGGTPGADIKADYAWDIQKGDPNILVCILDSGVDYNHPDLAANIWINPGEDCEPFGVVGPEDFNGVDDDGNGKVDDIRGWDFVTYSYTGPFWPRLYSGEDGGPADNDPMDFLGHGTNCSGVLADSNNSTGIAGVAWHCRIMAVRVMFAIRYESGGAMYGGSKVSDFANGLYYAANNGADVVSMSLGFWGSASNVQTIKDAIDYGYAEGCVLVAGAGNYFLEKDVPAMFNNVIAVAATDHNDERSVWVSYDAPERDRGSNYAAWVDVAAPGSAIYTTDVGGGYDPDFDGTSAATPHVAAAAAMILSQEPNLTNEEVAWILRRSADDIAEMGRDLLGYGRINVEEALNNSSKPVLKASIDFPAVSSYISNDNNVPILGYASGEDFNDYTLSWGVGKEPNSWILIAESNTPVEDSVLGHWDTNTLERNFYTLRLTVNDSNDESFDYRHIVLLNPDLAPGWPISVEGCMYHSSVTVADIDDDNDMEILGSPYVLQSYREWGYGDKIIFAFHHDACSVSGWPTEPDGYIYEGTPAIADIDGDSNAEIAVAVWSDHYVYLWHADGIIVSGWPKYSSGAGFLGAAAIYDLDGIAENGLEIIAAATNEDDDYGSVYAWHADGTLVTGWPQDCYMTYATPAVADVDADRKGEIFIGAYDNKMYAFNDDGTTLEGSWPVTVGGQIFSSAAIADIDDDGEYKIVVGCKDHKVYAWEIDGSSVTGWPKTTGGVIWSSPAIGDIDGDGGLDIVIGSDDCNVYAWHGDGTVVAGWPVTTGGEVKSSATIGDIDGDGQVEVVIGSYDRNIYAFNGDGTVVPGWPLITTGTNACSAAITDLDNDGDVDLTFGSNDFKLYVFDINAPYDPNKMPWPMAHRDVQNTGFYPSDRPVVVNTQPAFGGLECVVRQIEATFSEPVVNVSKDDLTLSVGTVISVNGANEGPYVFKVLVTEPGLINATLAGDINDLDDRGMIPYQWTFRQITAAGDFDCDGHVKLNDFAVLASHWMESDCNVLNNWCDGTDLDWTGQIDLSDLNIVAENWLIKPGTFYDGLVAYWSFDEGDGDIAYDYSGNDNDGTICGAVWVDGISGGALNFDGANDYVNCGNKASLDIDNEITIAAWVKRNAEGTSWEMIINKDPAGSTDDNWFLGINENTAMFRVTTDIPHNLDSEVVISAGSWYHLVGTYDKSYLRIYVNGEEKNSLSESDGIDVVNRDVHIGSASGGSSYPFNGLIDEVRIYNRALGPEEIRILYENP